MSFTKFVYVDVPPFPYTRTQRPVHPTPLSPTKNQNLHSSTQSFSVSHGKRPTSEIDASSSLNPVKKPKLLQSTNGQPTDMARCHQCHTQRVLPEMLQCTFLQTKKHGPQLRCTQRFCHTCLKNRYEQDASQIKLQPASSRSGHSLDETFVWTCPQCKDACNCPRCRKAKGLEPLGRKHAKILRAAPQDAPSAMSKARNPPRVVPVLNWTKIDTKLSWEAVQDRLFIREFVLRFGFYLVPPLPKTKIEELEVFGLLGSIQEADIVPWVSSDCVKAIILGTLGIIAAEENSDIHHEIKSVMKDIRSAGANLNKSWAALSTLRQTCTKDDDAYDEDKLCLAFPDPLPSPTRHFTRTAPTSELCVTHSAQMVPVIVELIHAALLTSVIRQAIDDGIQDGKDLARRKIEASKKEYERWEEAKKKIEESSPSALHASENDAKSEEEKELNKVKQEKLKVERQFHRQRLGDLDCAMHILSVNSMARFSPLGTDHEGRIYMALSPGVYSQDHAEAILEAIILNSTHPRTSSSKRRHALSEEDAARFVRWSWFLVVWGPRPVFDTDAIAEDKHPAIWGFSQPTEIHKLAEWISVTSGMFDKEELVTQKSSPSSSKVHGVNKLVKALKVYANTLAWRMKPSVATS